MQKKDITLRPAAQGDWHATASLLQENELPLDGAREHLSAFLVATTDGVIVGCAGAEVYGDVALLRSIAVAPLLKRKGIGKMMVFRLLHDAKQRQISTLYLLTITVPEYFARLGFQHTLIENAPQALRASAEFQGAYPANSTFMTLTIR